VDSGVEQGDEVTPFYDPMIAKLIAYGATREQAFDRLSTALGATVISGPRNNVEFLQSLANASEMRAGTVDTGYIERNLAALTKPSDTDFAAAAFAVETLMRREQAAQRGAKNSHRSPWDAEDGYDFGGTRDIPVPVVVNGAKVLARVRNGASGIHASVNGVEARASELLEAGALVIAIRDGKQTSVRLAEYAEIDLKPGGGNGAIAAPMHGKVLSVAVKKGDKVAKGQRLMVLEAMKMEHALDAGSDGVVAELSVAAGDQVSEGAQLVLIKSEPPPAKPAPKS
jgi:3-methylcrotonyl-CoA carboxylase alpha subunit